MIAMFIHSASSFAKCYQKILVILFSFLLTNLVSAHDLKVKIEGRNIDVVHFHKCTPKEMGIDPDVSIKVHRKVLKKKSKAMLVAQANALVSVINGAIKPPRVKRTSPPDNGINCHGLTFDSGKSWIDDPIDIIHSRCKLLANQKNPPVGTTVVYADGLGNVLHSGKVIRRGPGGKIWVKSQWGKLGDFEHLAGAVPTGQRHIFIGSDGKKHIAQEANYGKPTYWRCS